MAKKKPPIRTPMLLFGDKPQLIRELGNREDVTLAELKDEYARLRKLGMQRIRRLEKAGYGWTVTAQAYRGDLIAPSTLTDKGSAAAALARVTQLMTAQTTTVSGMRAYERRVTESLQEDGYQITTDQLRAYGDFMDWARELGLVRAYTSDAIARAFTERSERAKNGSNSEQVWRDAIKRRLGEGWRTISKKGAIAHAEELAEKAARAERRAAKK